MTEFTLRHVMRAVFEEGTVQSKNGQDISTQHVTNVLRAVRSIVSKPIGHNLAGLLAIDGGVGELREGEIVLNKHLTDFLCSDWPGQYSSDMYYFIGMDRCVLPDSQIILRDILADNGVDMDTTHYDEQFAARADLFQFDLKQEGHLTGIVPRAIRLIATNS